MEQRVDLERFYRPSEMSMRSRLMYSEVYEAFVEPHQSMFLGPCFIEQEQRFIRRSQRSLRVSLSLCHVSVCVVVLVYVNVCVCICVRVCVCPQDLSTTSVAQLVHMSCISGEGGKISEGREQHTFHFHKTVRRIVFTTHDQRKKGYCSFFFVLLLVFFEKGNKIY